MGPAGRLPRTGPRGGHDTLRRRSRSSSPCAGRVAPRRVGHRAGVAASWTGATGSRRAAICSISSARTVRAAHAATARSISPSSDVVSTRLMTDELEQLIQMTGCAAADRHPRRRPCSGTCCGPVSPKAVLPGAFGGGLAWYPLGDGRRGDVQQRVDRVDVDHPSAPAASLVRSRPPARRRRRTQPVTASPSGTDARTGLPSGSPVRWVRPANALAGSVPTEPGRWAFGPSSPKLVTHAKTRSGLIADSRSHVRPRRSS